LIAADSHRAIKGEDLSGEVYRGNVRTKGAGHPHADNAEADSTAQLKAAIPIVFIGIQRAARVASHQAISVVISIAHVTRRLYETQRVVIAMISL